VDAQKLVPYLCQEARASFSSNPDGCYYRIILMQQMLPFIRSIAGDVYVFQQDSAPGHRPCQTVDWVEVLQRETPKFIAPNLWPPNSPDLNPIDYRI